MSPELETIRGKAEKLTQQFSDDDWQRAPAGKWCALQTFEHLLLTFSATTKGTLRAMEAGEPSCREVTLRDRVATLYVVGLGVFPKGRSAPKHTLPKGALQTEPLRRFNDALVAMDATLMDAERRFGKKTKLLEHPGLGPLTADQWRKFHRVHANHHFRQVAARVQQGSSARASAGTSS